MPSCPQHPHVFLFVCVLDVTVHSVSSFFFFFSCACKLSKRKDKVPIMSRNDVSVCIGFDLRALIIQAYFAIIKQRKGLAM